MIGPTANKLPDTIPEMFDLFIARWAISGVPDVSVADKILSNILAADDMGDANHLQCAAVLTAISGAGRGRSGALLDRAIKVASTRKTRIFSCVSYRYSAPKDFIDDCETLKRDRRPWHN